MSYVTLSWHIFIWLVVMFISIQLQCNTIFVFEVVSISTALIIAVVVSAFLSFCWYLFPVLMNMEYFQTGLQPKHSSFYCSNTFLVAMLLLADASFHNIAPGNPSIYPTTCHIKFWYLHLSTKPYDPWLFIIFSIFLDVSLVIKHVSLVRSSTLDDLPSKSSSSLPPSSTKIR